jgi:Putative zinc-finger
MCDFSGRLVAWMDREVPDAEAVDVERHVRDCSECQKRVTAYQEVSRAFVAYCDLATEGKARSKRPQWVPVLSSAAAATLLLIVFQTAVFQPASVKGIPLAPRLPDTSPATALETGLRPVKRVHRRRVVIAPVKIPNANWTLAGPTIQIALPGEAMFPPGAVPEGITFIADLSMAADGSVQALWLQP